MAENDVLEVRCPSENRIIGTLPVTKGKRITKEYFTTRFVVTRKGYSFNNNRTFDAGQVVQCSVCKNPLYLAEPGTKNDIKVMLPLTLGTMSFARK